MMNIITSLNNKGYGIKKTEDNQELIKKIKQELLVSPKVFSNAAFSVEKEYPSDYTELKCDFRED